MSSNEQDQRYLDSITIVDAYERAARSEQSRCSALLNMDAAVGALEAILNAAELSLEQMHMPTGESPASGEVSLLSGGGEGQVLGESNSQSENSCDPFVEYKGGTTFEVGREYETGASTPIDYAAGVAAALNKIGVETTPEKIAEDMKNCFDCDLRPQFNFQIKPINFLSELMPLIEGIHDAVDQVLDALEPLDILKWLCEIGDLFSKGWCIADLISLLLAWKGLLQKYFGQMFRIAMNWTFIIGPLIKFIVDMVASLLEQIRRIIIAPIDCIAKVLSQLSQLQKAVVDTVDETVAFAQMFPDFWDQKFGTKSKTQYTGVTTDESSYLKKTKGNSPKSVGLPTGFSFSTSDTLESVYEKKIKARKFQRQQRKKRKYLESKGVTAQGGPHMSEEEIKKLSEEADLAANAPSILEQMIAGTNSAKSWVNQLFANVLLAVKSLNTFVVGTLSLSVKLSGFVLMILDMIKLFVFIINSFESGMNIEELCDTLKNDPEYAKELMNTWFKHESRGNISKDREDWQRMMEEFKKPPEEDCSPPVPEADITIKLP